MIKDRGMKKWQGMMLPEHVKLLREYSEEQKKTPRPQLDEWDLHAIEETLQIAFKRKCDVLLKLWKDGEFKLHGGSIESVDINKRTIQIDDPFGIMAYNLNDIVDVTVSD